MHKRYVIYFTGLFEHGYVRHTWRLKKPTDKRLATMHEGKEFATKFRFKWAASLFCWLLNADNKVNYKFRTYEVLEINAN